VETNDPQLKKLGPGVRRGGYVAGIAFAIEDGPAHYLPVRHAEGDNLPADHVWSYLRDQARRFQGTIVGANFSYDLDYLMQNGVEFPNVEWFRDIQIAEPLIDDLQDSYSLQSICERYEIPGKDEALLRAAAEEWGIHPKLGIWKLPGRYAAAYGIGDVLKPLQILRRQERRIEEEGLWQIYNLESKVLPVLVKMRRRGVRIDFDKLEKIERWSEQEEKIALQKVYDATGVRIEVGDVWKKEGLAKALQHVGVKLERTAGGKTKRAPQWKITNEVLDAVDHPIGELIRRARKVNKVRTTFINSVREHEIDGRIHCTFNQLRRSKDDGSGDERGARYGRLSSTDPNLQQQPGRDPEIGPMWRSVYIADEGMQWACLDYSKQEPRMLVHFAELTGCKGAADMAQRYRDEPKMDIYVVLGELTGTGYNDSKQLYLGLSYAMGGKKLCISIKKPTKWIVTRRGKSIEVAGDEGQAIMDKFHKSAPFITQLADQCEAAARERGFIKTILGRRCRFPRDMDGHYMWTHKALNRLIQGSSADQTKQAMVDADAAGHPLQLQVHDELNESVRDEAQAQELSDIMVNCVELTVPTVVGMGLGPNWGEAK